jgi:hypothetical protein
MPFMTEYLNYWVLEIIAKGIMLFAFKVVLSKLFFDTDDVPLSFRLRLSLLHIFLTGISIR